MRAEFNNRLIGILLCGSYAYGNPGPMSDIDLFVIIDDNWRQKRVIYRENMEFELFINPPQQIKKELTNGTDSTIDMFARGMILQDRDNRMQSLKELAIQLKTDGPTELSDEEVNFIRYILSDALKDLQDCIGNDQIFRIQYSTLLNILIQEYQRLNRIWKKKPKDFLQYLKKHNEKEYLIFESLSSREAPEILYDRINRYITNLLEPYGGPVIRCDWQTTPDVLKLD